MSFISKIIQNSKRRIKWKTIAIAGASTVSVGAFCVHEYLPSRSFSNAPFQSMQDKNPLFQSQVCMCKPLNADTCETEAIDAGELRSDPSSYYYKELSSLSDRNLHRDHAIFGSLMKKGLIERYKIYQRVCINPSDASCFADSEVVLASIRIGSSLNGHQGIVHGGIISLLMDDTFGAGYDTFAKKQDHADNEFPMVVTANLNINYRVPLPSDTNIVIRVFHTRSEGRKVYMHARVESRDGTILYAEGTVLFVKIQPEHLKK